MKKMLLAVLSDEMYSNRLSDYISRHKNTFFEFMVFTCTDSVEEFVKLDKIDILLADDKMAGNLPHVENIRKVIVLSDGGCLTGQKYPVIFKYQPAGHILKEIFEQAADDDNIPGISSINSSKNPELIAVFSPFGGAGTSTYAENLCSSMAGNNRVLYINLEIFDGFAEFDRTVENQRKYVRGMSEAVFYIKQRKDKLIFRLESIINQNKNGYSYILPVEDFRDLYSITPEDMEFFTNVLGRETLYDKIVFDIGYVNESSLKLLGICDVVILPQPSCVTQENKQHSFERLLIRNHMEKTAENIKYVTMGERCISD